MEKIMDEYGRFALDLLAMGLLLAYLFGTVTDAEGHRGILKIMERRSLFGILTIPRIRITMYMKRKHRKTSR